MKYIFIFIMIIFSCISGKAQNFPDSQTDGKYYEVNGAKLWIVSFGEGDPLFLLAGGPGNSHYYMRRFDPLSDNNKLINIDGFGRGKSDTAKDISEYSLARDIDDIEALREVMGFSKFNVLGHSYGGVVAQGYAIKYPNNVSHLIIANSFHSYLMWQANDDNYNHEIKTNYPEVWAELMKVRNEGAISSDKVHQDIYKKIPYGFLYAYNPENYSNKSKRSYPNDFNYKLYYQMVGKDGDFIVGNDIGNFDYRKDLKNLNMPILIIAGRYDRVAVPSMMIKYKEYCPQAEFVMFEKSGHGPHVEEPEKVFELIRNFLSK